jgi:hypothetical protein
VVHQLQKLRLLLLLKLKLLHHHHHLHLLQLLPQQPHHLLNLLQELCPLLHRHDQPLHRLLLLRFQ